MQRSGPPNVAACLLVLIGLILQAPPAASQAPVNPLPQKRVINPAAARLAQRTYVPPPPTQAILTLTADSRVVKPNQDVHFTLAWNRTVVRVNYHFDWGDGTSGSDTTVPTATYRYPAPGVYPVRVTATPILPAERMMALKSSQVPSIQSNAVTIVALAPPPPPPQPQPQPQPPPPTTVALTADKTSVNLGDPVSFTATLTPPSPTAQFHFDFGDGNTLNAPSNLAAHNYALAGPHSATVTVSDASGNQQATSPPVEVTVIAPAPPPPVVQLAPLFQGPVITGQSISVQAILNPPTRNQGFEFDWGDGTPLQSVNSQGLGTHTYTTPGSMEVIVTALTDEAYQPPLQSSLHVQIDTKSWWPPSVGIVAGVGGTVIVIAFIGWLIFKPAPPTPPTTESHIVQQQFRYEASEGSALYKLNMARPSSDIGPLKLSSGMGSEEHRIKFPSRADTSN